MTPPRVPLEERPGEDARTPPAAPPPLPSAGAEPARAPRLPIDQERLRLLLETTHAIPWEANAETWEFTYVGPQAERLLGFPLERWYEKDFWASRIHPDDRRAAVDFCQESSRLCKGYEFEYRMMAADGRPVWLHDIVSVETVDGRPAMLRGFMIDISDRKRAEEALVRNERQLRLMADSLPVLLVYVDSRERYLFTNTAYDKAVGRDREQILGHTIEEVLGEEAYARLRPYIRKALAGSKVAFQIEIPIADGPSRHLQAAYVPHVGTRGEVQGYYGVVSDITDRVTAEDDADRLREQLAHVARAASMGELAASFAHELNQPLCGIVSNAQAGLRLLSSEGADLPGVREALADIAEDGKRAGDVIRGLRSILGRGSIEGSPLEVNELIQEVGDLVRRDARRKEVPVTFDLAAGLPRVHGNRVQLQQVVLNLINNAREAVAALEQGEGEVHVSTSIDSSGAVAISVRDTGVGISPEAVERIFDAFYTTKEDGMGMGLSINRSIVDAHGGAIRVVPGKDPGSTFEVLLPALEEEAR